MLQIAITSISIIREVIELLIQESNKKSPGDIILEVIQAKSLPIRDIIILSNFIKSSSLNVKVYTYEDLNFNEFAILATCSNNSAIMADYTEVKMESYLQIPISDLTTVAYLISENTKYKIQDVLNDYEKKVTLKGSHIFEYGISKYEIKQKNAIKIESLWIAFDLIEPFNPDDKPDPIGPINPIIPNDPQMI